MKRRTKRVVHCRFRLVGSHRDVSKTHHHAGLANLFCEAAAFVMRDVSHLVDDMAH